MRRALYRCGALWRKLSAFGSFDSIAGLTGNSSVKAHPHMPEVRKVFTLQAGNNRLSTMLASVSTSIQMQLTYLRWRVKAAGPVAKGDSAMAALTDGDSFALDEGDTEHAYGTDRIDATQIYFRPTTGGTDKIFIEARSA